MLWNKNGNIGSTSDKEATLLAHLQSLFVSTFSFFFLKERIHKHDVIEGVMIGLAVILIIGRVLDNIVNLKLGNMGDLAVLLATLEWVLVAIPDKRLTKYASSILIVSYRFPVASTFFFPLLLFFNHPTIKSIYQVLLEVAVGLGCIFHYEGLNKGMSSSAYGVLITIFRSHPRMDYTWQAYDHNADYWSVTTHRWIDHTGTEKLIILNSLIHTRQINSFCMFTLKNRRRNVSP